MYCQQVVSLGKVVNITGEALCPDDKPPATRTCFRPQCPTVTPITDTHDIEIDTSNYVQLKQRRKISITVGGTATVIPGTNLIIKCPVKKYDKNFIHWRRKDNEIAKKGRIKVSKQGNLQIRRSRPHDSDMYECMIVMDNDHIMHTANISINFHSDLEGEEQLEWRKQYMMEMHKNGAHKTSSKYLEQSANTIHKMGTNDKLLMNSIMGDEMNYSIPYVYISSKWSPCTKTCGGAGYQKRSISCELITENYYR